MINSCFQFWNLPLICSISCSFSSHFFCCFPSSEDTLELQAHSAQRASCVASAIRLMAYSQECNASESDRRVTRLEQVHPVQTGALWPWYLSLWRHYSDDMEVRQREKHCHLNVWRDTMFLPSLTSASRIEILSVAHKKKLILKQIFNVMMISIMVILVFIFLCFLHLWTYSQLIEPQ